MDGKRKTDEKPDKIGVLSLAQCDNPTFHATKTVEIEYPPPHDWSLEKTDSLKRYQSEGYCDQTKTNGFLALASTVCAEQDLHLLLRCMIGSSLFYL